MIYISPTGSFNNPRADLTDNDAGQLVKVQIENSFELGWKKEDIILATNFNFEYGGIKSMVLTDVDFFDRKPQASKINAILKLFEGGLIDSKELYWFHDFDAYQLEPFTESELALKNDEMGVADYNGRKFGGVNRWNTASMFFRIDSHDIFQKMKDLVYKKRIDEEDARTGLRFLAWTGGGDVTTMQRAAYLALVNKEFEEEKKSAE